MGINIKIVQTKLEMPDRKEEAEAKVPTMSLCQRADLLIKKIEREDNSDAEAKRIWKRLKTIYSLVNSSKYTKEDKDKLLTKLTPVMLKYIQYDPNGIDINPHYIAKGAE